jgi:multiple sugar transport system permease protein
MAGKMNKETTKKIKQAQAAGRPVDERLLKEQPKKLHTKGSFRKALFGYSILILGAIIMIGPFMWMVTTSLSHEADVFAKKSVWWLSYVPTSFVWENYIEAWHAVPFARFFINSIFASVCTTFGQVATSAMAGYAFARLSFPGRDKIFLAYLATMMIPFPVTMIPVFILFREIGWIDTYKALILPGIFTAYGTFMLRQFFMTLPRDLEDAAKIDGCGYGRIFLKIILPLSKPALATLTTFTFLGSWMNFMWPLVVLNSHEKFTLPVGLSYFQSVHTTNWTLLMAGSLIVLVPVLIVFIFNQRYFVEGIKLSGIKG